MPGQVPARGREVYLGDMRLLHLSVLALLSGCAPSLHPQLERVEIPAERPRPLLLLPLESPGEAPPGAEATVRQLLSVRLEADGVRTVPAERVEAAVRRLHGEQPLEWTRAQAAELADSLGARYVLSGQLESYSRGKVLGRSSRLAWRLELLDARTRRPLARVALDLRGGQDDPFRLLQESAGESSAAILRAWEGCPAP